MTVKASGSSNNQINKILVRRLDNLGDIILAIPVFRELKKNFPSASLSAMVKPDHRPLLYACADDFIFPQPLDRLSLLADKYDLIINIEYTLPKNYRPVSTKKNTLIHIGAVAWERKKHIYKHLLDGLKAHHLDVSYGQPAIKLSPEAKQFAREWYKKENLSKQEFIITINPGSRFTKKIWPTQNFIAISRWLIDQFNSRIIVTGRSIQDKRVAELYANLSKSNRHLLVNRPINHVAAVMHKTDLFIGNDSGTSHLAAALNLPSVNLFGPSAPGYWRPADPKSVIVYNHKLHQYQKEGNPDKPNRIDFFTGLKPTAVIDGILLCINRHIDRTKKRVLNAINVSKNLETTDIISGVILKNRITGHACLVNKGWNYIARFLDSVNNLRSLSKIHELYPDEDDFISLLLLHRIIESDRAGR